MTAREQATMTSPYDERPTADAHGVEYETVEPRAEAMIESLRAFGYSPETAIADIVDNSLAAGASTVAVHFQWRSDESWVAVCDDGSGMTEETLREAMRPGSFNPLSKRVRSDLGRFGLGLKTASFSQCRRLVVMSATGGGQPAARVWDLDRVAATGRWHLLTDLSGEDRDVWERLGPQDGRGTVVLWRKLDRLVDAESMAAGLAERQFYSMADRVTEHLRMIFHRFLLGQGRRVIRVNRRLLDPWDPFLRDLPATQPLGDETLLYRDQTIGVRSFVLPHVSHLNPAQYQTGQGPRGWTSQQGFYVYRNRRLIVAGDWLGLGFAREEATKLARIQLDIPNTMDQDWQLDVRKSVVRAPGALVPHLRRVAEVARRSSTQVYRHRGKTLQRAGAGERELTFVWEQRLEKGKLAYRVNRRHPLVKALSAIGGHGSGIEALLRMVEETVPVPLIILDHSGGGARQAEPFELGPAGGIREVAANVARALRDSGLSEQETKARLLAMEPFAGYPDVVAAVVEQESA
ncbi:ATP-binding protein [Micromonospora arida]|uniref:ATP-binding protein n=1 Tax=Micromonospora arida TaxID=2203715 RepID=UPI003CF9FAFB